MIENTELNLGIVMRPCHNCNGTDLTITEKEFHGETFYLLHHKDYGNSENRKCGTLVYDWDKDNLIKCYNRGDMHGA